MYMTQIFNDEGRVHPVTLVEISPTEVSLVRTQEKDGYEAVQLSAFVKKQKPTVKKEARNMTGEKGSIIDPTTLFAIGDKVTVSAISKGKGFAGGVKRHGFAGGNRSHGNHHAEREVGSIGSGLRTRVPKGMRMAGRMGSDKVTVKNKIVRFIDATQHVIMISGSLPGKRGTLVEIYKK